LQDFPAAIPTQLIDTTSIPDMQAVDKSQNVAQRIGFLFSAHLALTSHETKRMTTLALTFLSCHKPSPFYDRFLDSQMKQEKHIDKQWNR
jgi:hypothetical protein